MEIQTYIEADRDEIIALVLIVKMMVHALWFQ